MAGAVWLSVIFVNCGDTVDHRGESIGYQRLIVPKIYW
jgi:hypothetical protein